VVKWALKVELYASCYLEMLKAPVVKIELRFDRNNRSRVEKIKVLSEALYQEYETDFLNVADPFRRQRTQTRFNFSQQLPRQKKDAAQRFINALLKFFKGGLNHHKIFLRYEYSRFTQLSAGT
jgi:hypothetical protein